MLIFYIAANCKRREREWEWEWIRGGPVLELWNYSILLVCGPNICIVYGVPSMVNHDKMHSLFKTILIAIYYVYYACDFSVCS